MGLTLSAEQILVVEALHARINNIVYTRIHANVRQEEDWYASVNVKPKKIKNYVHDYIKIVSHENINSIPKGGIVEIKIRIQRSVTFEFDLTDIVIGAAAGTVIGSVTGGTVGILTGITTGAIVGSLIGTAIGSVVPGPGNAVGAAVGSAVGGTIGGVGVGVVGTGVGVVGGGAAGGVIGAYIGAKEAVEKGYIKAEEKITISAEMIFEKFEYRCVDDYIYCTLKCHKRK